MTSHRAPHSPRTAPTGPVAVVGAGFIGGHLARALDQAGHPLQVCTAPGMLPTPGMRTVYWTAGRVAPAHQDPSLVTAEVTAFGEFLDTVADPAHPPRVVLASSGGTVYSPTAPPPYREDDPLDPNNPYGAMKQQMEHMLLTHTDITPVVVRFANVYGPGQQPRRGLGVIAHWLDALRHGDPITMTGDPCSTRDYLYIDDATAILLRLHTAEVVPQIVNAGSGTPTALRDLAQLTLDTTGITQQLRPSPARSADRLHVWLDIHRAQDTLSWTPTTTLPDGLRHTWLAAGTHHRGQRPADRTCAGREPAGSRPGGIG